MIRRSTIHICFFIIIGIFVFSQLSAKSRISDIKRELSTLKADRGKSQDEIKIIEQDVYKLADSISVLKEEQRAGGNILGRYKLTQLLRKSEELETKLKKKKRAFAEIAKKITQLNKILISEYNKAIKNKSAQLSQIKNKKSKKYADTLAKLSKLIKKKEKFIGIPKISALKIDQIEISSIDTPADLLEKLDILHDLRDRLLRQMKKIDSRLDDIKKRKILIEQIRHFNTEVAFFSDDFVIHKTAQSEEEEEEDSEETGITGGEDGGTDGDTTDTGGDDGTDLGTDTDAGTDNQDLTDVVDTETQTADQTNLTDNTEVTTTDTTTDSRITQEVPYQDEIDIDRLKLYRDLPIEKAIDILKKEKDKLHKDYWNITSKINLFEVTAKERAKPKKRRRRKKR